MSLPPPPQLSPVCARCPRVHRRSCCEVEEGSGQALATLTRADVERITAATGRPPRAFVGEEWLTAEEALQYERARPVFEGYYRRGPLRWTLQLRGGACVFHQAGRGCSLALDTRPLACRLYPFEPQPDGNFTLLADRVGHEEFPPAAVVVVAEPEVRCLAVEESESMEALMRAFSVTLERLRGWAAALREESRRHGLATSGEKRKGGGWRGHALRSKVDET